MIKLNNEDIENLAIIWKYSEEIFDIYNAISLYTPSSLRKEYYLNSLVKIKDINNKIMAILKNESIVKLNIFLSYFLNGEDLDNNLFYTLNALKVLDRYTLVKRRVIAILRNYLYSLDTYNEKLVIVDLESDFLNTFLSLLDKIITLNKLSNEERSNFLKLKLITIYMQPSEEEYYLRDGFESKKRLIWLASSTCEFLNLDSNYYKEVLNKTIYQIILNAFTFNNKDDELISKINDIILGVSFMFCEDDAKYLFANLKDNEGLRIREVFNLLDRNSMPKKAILGKIVRS